MAEINGGNIFSALGNLIDTGVRFKSVGRQVATGFYTWQYAHRGVQLATPGPDGHPETHTYDIKTDSRVEAKRELLLARVQAVRELEIEQGEDTVNILTPDERELIDRLVANDAKEEELLMKRTVNGKTTVWKKMYTDNEEATTSPKQSVGDEIVAGGRQARFRIHDSAKKGERYFNEDVALILRDIDADRQKLKQLLGAPVDGNDDSRIRLDVIFEAYRQYEGASAEEKAKRVREAAYKFRDENRQDDSIIASANSSESWKAVKDGFKRGGSLFAGAVVAVGSIVLGPKIMGRVAPEIPISYIDFSQLHGTDAAIALVAGGILVAGIPALTALAGVGEGAAKFIVDQYQNRISRRKTRMRDKALDEELNIYETQEFNIDHPVVPRRRGLAAVLGRS